MHEQIVDRLSAHFRHELIGVGIFEAIVIFGEIGTDAQVFVFGEQIEFAHLLIVEHHTLSGIDNDVAFVVDNGIEFFGSHSEEVADFVGQRAEIPDVSHRHHELDVAAAFATHLLLGNLHTTTVAHNSFVANAFVFTAVTFIVLHGTENAFAEQTVAFGFV